MIKEASIQRLNIFTFFPSGHINSSWAKLMAMWNLHNIFASFKIHFPRWWDLTYCWFSSFKSLYQAFFSCMTQQFLERVVRALLCRELSLINKTWIHSVAWKSRLKYENVLMEMEGVRGKELQGFIFIPSSFLFLTFSVKKNRLGHSLPSAQTKYWLLSRCSHCQFQWYLRSVTI